MFALSTLGDHIYFRTDVTPNELVGRTWKVVDMSKPQLPRSESTSLDTASYESTTSENNQSTILYFLYLASFRTLMLLLLLFPIV